MTTFSNKTFLVTGGTTGIGAATVQALAERGATVIATGKNPETLDAAKERAPKNVEYVASDAGSLGDIRSLATLVRQKYDKLDGVVLNAGIAPFLPIEAWDETTFDNLFSVNVKGPFFLLQQLVPLLPEGASVVFNTSVVHEVGMATAAPYGATKGALRALVRSLSVELAPKKIRVNAVAPGPIATPIYDKMGMSKEQLDGFAAHMATRVPLGRFGEAKDIANAFVFLLSDDSAFVSGEELLVDGGLRNNAA